MMMTAWWGADPGPHSPGAAASTWVKRCGEPSPGEDRRLLLALAPHRQAGGAPQGGSPGVRPVAAGRAAPGPARHHRRRAGAGDHGGPGVRRQHLHPPDPQGTGPLLTLVTGHLMDERDYQGWRG